MSENVIDLKKARRRLAKFPLAQAECECWKAPMQLPSVFVGKAVLSCRRCGLVQEGDIGVTRIHEDGSVTRE